MMPSLKTFVLQAPSLEDVPESESMEPNFIKCKTKLLYHSHLDQADKELETRLEAIHGVYKALTTREVQFEFKTDHTFYQLK